MERTAQLLVHGDALVLQTNSLNCPRKGRRRYPASFLLPHQIVFSLAPEAEGHGTDVAIHVIHREEALAGWDLARFQRTTKGAGQSAGRGSDEIVERRIARLVDLRVNPIVLGHRRVDAEMEVGVETDDLPSGLLAGTKSGGESMAPT